MFEKPYGQKSLLAQSRKAAKPQSRKAAKPQSRKAAKKGKTLLSKGTKNRLSGRKIKVMVCIHAIRPWGFLCGFAALREAPLTFNGHFYSKVPAIPGEPGLTYRFPVFNETEGRFP